MSEQPKRPFKPDYFPEPFKPIPSVDLLKWADDLDQHIDFQESKSKYLEAKINKHIKREWMMLTVLIAISCFSVWILFLTTN